MIKITILICLIFLIFAITTVYSNESKPYVLHQALGEIIDGQENITYRIFGQIIGFTAARIYKFSSNEYRLHVLRNVDQRAQLLIINLTDKNITNLNQTIHNRVKTLQQKQIHFNYAVCPIEESKWTEKSVNKKLFLHDGSQLIVTFKQAQNDTLIVETLGGIQITIPDDQIADVTHYKVNVVKGIYYRVDPNISRLFFAPTARSLKAGSGYFADYWIFFPTLAFGVTDFLTLSGGMSLIPGAESQLFYFAPKLAYQASPKIGFATGFLYMGIPEEEDDLSLGYAVTTIGSERSGVTLGAGISLDQDSDRKPILLIGAESQLSRSVKLITENWIFTGTDDTEILFSGGVRFFGEKIAVDLALLTVKDAFSGEGFPFLPWVDFSYSFGN